ncbi:HTH-type transcriptional regulator GltC [bioreactor metagenome]|uniref:HTH-type transcriptional regulator GltC n=1 Tax=bioreactor metagenome TaxID=1076179 RepID=A0A644XJA8_9ZZZZ
MSDLLFHFTIVRNSYKIRLFQHSRSIVYKGDKRMNIQMLECFVVVSEEKNITSAAQKLFISQPAVSRQIQNLELELKAKLFHRTKPYLTLTATGESVLVQAQEIVNRCKNLKPEFLKQTNNLSGTLKIGFCGNLEYTSLFNCVSAMAEKYPLCKINFSKANMGVLYHDLMKGEYDIVFSPLTGFEDNEQIRTYGIIYAPYVLAVSIHHKFAERDCVSLSELSSEKFITFVRRESKAHSDMLIIDCKKAGFSPDIIAEVGDVYTYLLMIAANQGVALVGENLCEISPCGIIFVPIEEFSERQIVSGAAWIKNRESPICAAFIQELKKLYPQK